MFCWLECSGYYILIGTHLVNSWQLSKTILGTISDDTIQLYSNSRTQSMGSFLCNSDWIRIDDTIEELRFPVPVYIKYAS
jgi:hypothetical protein